MNEATPLFPRASHATDDGGHTSYVFHRDVPGREVAVFKDKDNHKADAQLFIAAPNLVDACKKLIDYRKRAGALNFQLEKADTFLEEIFAAICESEAK